ncbi:hypothetical protein EGM51_07375 [Verrucomicrobia bacterium S94]|nr:hypothetical protein EGM51_07375 [Verrucomicrobia bacterium S94]
MKNCLRLLFVLSLCICGASAQQGGIRGMVMDADFEVPLPGVKVVISETGQEAVTGDAGSYFLEQVEPGAYTLMFSKDGYTRFTQPQVIVSPGKLAEMDASLAGEYEEMDELVVKEISLGGASEIGLLNLRMESVAMMDSVGADLMSKAGASDAAQALTLVPGTTIQDGKYAVVRGLPDRYVASLMNNVRLPSADPDKRAVQLDQFPSAMIESVQVSKTFTPDQQGDASGGAVNIMLKGIPDERVLQFKIGTKYKTGVADAGSGFLLDDAVDMGTWGHIADDIQPQDINSTWSGVVGVERGDSQPMYDWSLTAGDKFEVGSDLKVGFIGSLFYKRDASYSEGRNDKYWLENDGGLQDTLTPKYSGDNPYFNFGGNSYLNPGSELDTSLYDFQQGSEELQWGTLAGFGAETENHAVNLLYSYTFTGESTARLSEDTRGKYYFFPGYDPDDVTSPGGADSDSPVFGGNQDFSSFAPFNRKEELDYTERTANSLQLRGDHTIPFGGLRIGSVFTFNEPEIDWTVAWSGSTMDTPDRRSLETYWRRDDDGDGIHRMYNDDGGRARLIRTWRNVEEDSFQYFGNLNLPFEAWNDEEGFIKLGGFDDSVERSFDQNSFYTTQQLNSQQVQSSMPWEELWSSYLSDEQIEMNDYPFDVNYDGTQDITAFYLMGDLPLASFFKITGGVRFEKTDLSTVMRDVDPNAQLYIPANNYGPLDFAGNEALANASINQNDVLPSVGFEFSPHKKFSLRGSYTETIARMTFKELVPIEQVDTLGDDPFIGNPDLEMSSIRNYDLRFDYNPYTGGLVSVSWFYKELRDVIDYRQQILGAATLATTPDNYSEGTINGYEFEVRQSLGEWWEPLEGLDLGANFTLIQSELDASGAELDALAGLPEIVDAEYDDGKRDMMGTPEYLYNINATYTVPQFGTELGLFYIFKGDALKAAGTQDSNRYIPNIYEKGYGVLNFSVSQELGNHFSIGFKAKNLLDPEIQSVYRSEYAGEEAVHTSYKKGIEYSVGVSATW